MYHILNKRPQPGHEVSVREHTSDGVQLATRLELSIAQIVTQRSPTSLQNPSAERRNIRWRNAHSQHNRLRNKLSASQGNISIIKHLCHASGFVIIEYVTKIAPNRRMGISYYNTLQRIWFVPSSRWVPVPSRVHVKSLPTCGDRLTHLHGTQLQR